jgi:hypothetical protein
MSFNETMAQRAITCMPDREEYRWKTRKRASLHNAFWKVARYCHFYMITRRGKGNIQSARGVVEDNVQEVYASQSA